MYTSGTTMTGTGRSTPSGREQEATLGQGAQEVLGKDAFLQLLLTQLRYQDPMKPVDDQQFLAQMAQFSALEQMQNLSSTMEQFVREQREINHLAQATNLLGRVVEVKGSSGQTYIGTVDAIQMLEGVPRLVVDQTMFHVQDVLRIVHNAS